MKPSGSTPELRTGCAVACPATRVDPFNRIGHIPRQQCWQSNSITQHSTQTQKIHSNTILDIETTLKRNHTTQTQELRTQLTLKHSQRRKPSTLNANLKTHSNPKSEPKLKSKLKLTNPHSTQTRKLNQSPIQNEKWIPHTQTPFSKFRPHWTQIQVKTHTQTQASKILNWGGTHTKSNEHPSDSRLWHSRLWHSSPCNSNSNSLSVDVW